MKSTFKIIGKWVAPVVLAALPAVVNAQVTYYWVNVPGAGVEYDNAVGSITLNASGTAATSYFFDVGSYNDGDLTPNDPFDFSDNVNIMDINEDQSGIGALGSTPSSENGTWETNGSTANPLSAYFISPTEIPLDQLNYNGDTLAQGYWEAVPEPSTIVSGALLLVPLATGMVGMLRNRKSGAVVVGPVGENTVEQRSADPSHLSAPPV